VGLGRGEPPVLLDALLFRGSRPGSDSGIGPKTDPDPILAAHAMIRDR
jgi:hypothetical protein